MPHLVCYNLIVGRLLNKTYFLRLNTFIGIRKKLIIIADFSRSSSEMDLITRRVIAELEGGDPDRDVLLEYADPDSERYRNMIDAICKELNFTSLRYHRLDDMIEAIGVPADKLCTYCWNGKH